MSNKKKFTCDGGRDVSHGSLIWNKIADDLNLKPVRNSFNFLAFSEGATDYVYTRMSTTSLVYTTALYDVIVYS